MSPVAVHTVFEALAYAIGFRTFLWTHKRLAPAAFTHEDHVAWVAVGAIVGAALGAKLAFWLDDPLAAFQDFPSLAHLLEGKSIVGALLGGLIGVEGAKKIAGVGTSGDPLRLAPQGVLNGQVLRWDSVGRAWHPGAPVSVTTPPASFTSSAPAAMSHALSPYS